MRETPYTAPLTEIIRIAQEQRCEAIVQRLKLRHRRLEISWQNHLRAHAEEMEDPDVQTGRVA